MRKEVRPGRLTDRAYNSYQYRRREHVRALAGHRPSVQPYRPRIKAGYGL